MDHSDLDGASSDNASCEESKKCRSESDDVSTADVQNKNDEEAPDYIMEVYDEEQTVLGWTKIQIILSRKRVTLLSIIYLVVHADVNRSTNKLDTFLKLFQSDLFEKIALYET